MTEEFGALGRISRPAAGTLAALSRQLGLDAYGGLAGIACTDPRLALALAYPTLRPDYLGAQLPQCGQYGLQYVSVSATFVSGAANQVLTGRQNGIVETDLWIKRVAPTVERPNAFAGSIFKAQSDALNAENPSIHATCIVKSYCRYTLAIDPIPLQNFAVDFNECCPVGMVLGCSAQIESQIENLRVLAADENPTIVSITFVGIRLPVRYDICAVDMAVAALEAAGIFQRAA